MPAPKDPERYAAFCQAVRDRQLGRKLSAEQKAKIGASVSRAKTGVSRPDMRGDGNPMRRPEVAAKFRGERNPKYVAVPGYFGAHDRLEAKRGKASDYPCTNCQGKARHWALRKECATHIGRASGGNPCAYSIHPEDYMTLCASCHKRYDLGLLTL